MDSNSRVKTIATTFVFAVLVLFANAGAAHAQSTHYATVPYNTTNQVYEVMKISRDSANWSQSGYEITVRNTYFNGGGIVKAFVGYGYQDSGTLTILEAAGQNQPKIFLGSEAVVSGTIKYVPVYIQVPAYQVFFVEVKFGTAETTSITASGQVYFTGTSSSSGANGANHDGSVNFTGNVGIGRTNPARTLQIVASNDVGIMDSSQQYELFMQQSSSYARIGPTYWSGGSFVPLTFWTSDTERLRIVASGNVGIGTTSPGEKLDVSGTFRASGQNSVPTSGAGVEVSYGSGVGYIQSYDRSTGGGNKPLYVSGNTIQLNGGGEGNVGIGTTTPASLLSVGAAWSPAYIAGFSGSTGRIGVNSTVATTPGFIDFNSNSQTAYVGLNGSQANGLFSSGGLASALSVMSPAGKAVQIGAAGSSPAITVLDGNASFGGNITAIGSIAAKYQDVAEWVPASARLVAGTVVVLDSTKSNQVTSSSVSYDTRVAGVVSEQPGIALGEKSDGKVLVATTGRVRVKVDASKGPIHVGDLLVTSDLTGVAMKSEPVNLGGVQLHRPGTLIGKALEPLEKGKGEILVLLSLQ